MDAYLAIVSKREVREYRPDPIPEEEMNRILEAGRATGSSRNRQHWRFVILRDRKRLGELSPLVTRPSNLTGCAAAVAVVLTNPHARFDAGRVAQNMMVAAWSLGIGSCPNTPRDEPALKAALRVPDEAGVPTVLSLGYPARGEPRPRPDAGVEGVLSRINRLPLRDLVYREVYGG